MSSHFLRVRCLITELNATVVSFEVSDDGDGINVIILCNAMFERIDVFVIDFIDYDVA